jgi:hypothetical protein
VISRLRQLPAAPDARPAAPIQPSTERAAPPPDSPSVQPPAQPIARAEPFTQDSLEAEPPTAMASQVVKASEPSPAFEVNPSSYLLDLKARQERVKPPEAQPFETQPPAELRISAYVPLADASASAQAPEPQAPGSGAREPVPPAATQTVVPRKVYQPLLTQISRPDAPGPASVPSIKGGTTSFAQSAERQGEEIQIHIGRIDVTALPPSAPVQPRTQPVRRALKLEEYLRRGTGRTS